MENFEDTVSFNNLTINGSLILNSDPNNPLIISSELLSVLKKAPFVTISTNQLISGNKIFKNPIKYNFEELDPTLADNTLVTAEWVLNQGFSTFSGQGSVSISSAETITGLKTFSQVPNYSGAAINLTTNDGTLATTEFVKGQGYLKSSDATSTYQRKDSAITNAENAENATNISGGSKGQILYQDGTNTTAFLATGAPGLVLKSMGSGNAPEWTNSLTIGSMQEIITPVTAGSIITLDYSKGAIFSLTSNSNTNFTIVLQNFTPVANRVYTITLLISTTTTNKNYADTFKFIVPSGPITIGGINQVAGEQYTYTSSTLGLIPTIPNNSFIIQQISLIHLDYPSAAPKVISSISCTN
jgi:hypothetical protein